MISRAIYLSLIFLLELSSAFVIEEECLNYTLYPVQYEVIVKPYLYADQRFYYDCDLIITVIVNAPNVNVIELDAKDLEVTPGSIKVLHSKTNRDLVNDFRPYEFDSKRGVLFIYLKDDLRKYSVDRSQYFIKISFRKFVKFDSVGVFVVKYEDQGPRYMLTTRLSPNKAKYFFPCFDNPQFEAVVKVKVYVIPQHGTLQNNNTTLVIAQEQRRNSLKDNYVTIDYTPSPQIGVHQFGFHLSQFTNRQVKCKYSNDSLVVWAPESKIHQYSRALEYGELMINWLHEYCLLNRPIVNGPINLVAVPGNLNGYEIGSWNLLTNGETKLAFIPQYTSIKQLEKMRFELTQQLCRIWLGNPGEPQRTRWKEEWFKEGVATYLTYYLMTQYNKGSLNLRKRWPITTYGLEMRNKAMTHDWLHSTPALLSFNRTLAVDVPSRYKELVTMKTASLLWMVENWIGSEKFHQALVKYINSRRGKYISLDDFTKNLDLDTLECFNQFFNGSTASRVLNSWFGRPGYPVINVQVLRDRIPNAIQLKQKPFSFAHDRRQESDFLIPISYVIQNKEDCFNCHQPQFTIGYQTYTFEENLSGGWIILNRNASGYYRVNYDEVTWRLIAKSLQEDAHSIDELNRAQIVNDVYAIYASGALSSELAMEVLNFLSSEESQVVWESAMSGFELLKIDGVACNMTKTVYEQWQNFMRKKVSSIYKRMMSDVEKQSKERLFRSRLIDFTCAINFQPCLNVLRHMYNERRLDPDSRGACYLMVLKQNVGDIGHELNVFEQDDVVNAEHKLHEENRFLYRIPMGRPKPMPIIMATEPPRIQSTIETIVAENTSSGIPVYTVSSIHRVFVLVTLAFVLR